MSRLGPMDMARMAAHRPAAPAARMPAAAGRSLRAEASSEPEASWSMNVPWSISPAPSRARTAEAARNIGTRSRTARGGALPATACTESYPPRARTIAKAQTVMVMTSSQGNQAPCRYATTESGERPSTRRVVMLEVGRRNEAVFAVTATAAASHPASRSLRWEARSASGMATTTATSRLTRALSAAVKARTAPKATRRDACSGTSTLARN